MKFPWQKQEKETEIDPYVKAAAGCFGLARNYMQKPSLGDTSHLDVCDYYRAVCEIVCFLLHMADRTIFDKARDSRAGRMDALVMATVQVFAEEIRTDPNVPNAVTLLGRLPTLASEPDLPPGYGANNTVTTREQYDAARARLSESLNREAQRRIAIEKSNDALSVATEIFGELYDERMEEYSGVGDDWLRTVLSKFGRNLSAAVNQGEFSFEIYTDAQTEGVSMHSALVGFVPELFKP